MQSRSTAPAAATPCWRPSALLLGVGCAAVLLLSWLFAPTAAAWQWLDDSVFGLTNPWLATPGLWQAFVAVTNWRPFDLVSGLLAAGLVLVWLRAPRPEQARKLAVFTTFCLLLLAVAGCSDLLVDALHYRRASATLVYPDAVRLSEHVHWIATKDRGSTVFPGDHAAVLFAVMGFLWLHAGTRAGVCAMLVLVPFMLPRILVGAHWVSDIVVGGGVQALVLLIVGYATPLAALIAQWLQRYAAQLLDFGVATGRRLRLL